MQFHVLGPIRAHNAHGMPLAVNAKKPAALLAVLLLNPNAWVSVVHLIEAIWHEQDAPRSAIPNLRSYVFRLRQDLGDRLESRPGAYRIRVLPGELDADRAETLAAAATSAFSRGAHAEADGLLTEALSLWRGRPFDEMIFDDALLAADRLDELHWKLRELKAETAAALGGHAEAARLLRGVVAEDPLRERAWARLVDVLRDAGIPAAALAAYDEAERVLEEELGVEPGPELALALMKVLRGPGVRQPERHRGTRPVDGGRTVGRPAYAIRLGDRRPVGAVPEARFPAGRVPVPVCETR